MLQLYDREKFGTKGEREGQAEEEKKKLESNSSRFEVEKEKRQPMKGT